MSRADARHLNLPGSFNGFFASSRNSQSDPKAAIEEHEMPGLREVHSHESSSQRRSVA
jgi:hypothetical protein